MSFKYRLKPKREPLRAAANAAACAWTRTPFSPRRFSRPADESMWQQIGRRRGVRGRDRRVPDARHALGYGVPVGCVIVTDDTIIQAGSGYDISCGVLYMRVPGLSAEHVCGLGCSAQRWVDAVEKSRRDRRRHRPAALACRASRRTRPTTSSATAPRRIGVSAERVRASVHPDPRRRRLDAIERAYDKVVAAARLGRRRQPLHRDAGRPRQRLRSG